MGSNPVAVTKMILLSHMVQFRLGTSRFAPATSHMGKSFQVPTNQAIPLLIKSRKTWTESFSR